MLRQILIASFAAIVAASPVAAQKKIEIPGLGTIYFGGGGQRQRVDPRRIDPRFKVLDRKRNFNDERRVVFDVGRNQGRFSQLRLRATGKVARITGLEVVFGNGRSQDIKIYEPIYPGQVSEALDLTGDARGIRRVIITKRPTWQRERGSIELLGLPEDVRSKFDVLGTERINRRYRDVVFDSLPRRDRFDEIRLKALDRPVRIDDVVIVFGNGKRQRVDVDQRLRAGESTKPISLAGRSARNIDRVRVDIDRIRGRRGRLQLLARSDRDTRRPRASAQKQVPKDWVLFGSETIGFRGERHVIPIGKDAGVFDRVTFRALRNDIEIRDVTIVYGNGVRDRVDVDLLVPAGYGTPPIDLKSRRGKGRHIRQIVVRYRADVRNRRKTAQLQVFGEYADDWLRESERRAGRGNKWVLLGARKAGMFSKDDDSIHVGKRFGRFRAVKVRVRKEKVKLYGMTVTYENGTTEAVPIYGKLRNGQSSQPFDLKGRKRFIRRVDLRYKTSFNLGGSGTVEVWGQR
ncbi:MAG: hypothetical protein K0U34_06250 [Alphaproteobacteria bacterium]|nr:hypothetical protein [Alphaproteobacteria bacterium]